MVYSRNQVQTRSKVRSQNNVTESCNSQQQQLVLTVLGNSLNRIICELFNTLSAVERFTIMRYINPLLTLTWILTLVRR